MKVSEQIEAIQNAIDLLESLGYTSGDIHDGLVATLEARKRRQALLIKLREDSERYAKGLGPFNPEVKG